MPTSTQVSDFAHLVLLAHARRPDRLFYAVEVLGGMFPDSELLRLDASYQELEKAGLMEKSGEMVSFFGVLKSLYRLTPEGAALAATNGGSAA